METKDTDRITFRVSPEELQTIDEKANAADLTRTDYIRAKLFAPDNTDQITKLEQQIRELAGRFEKEAERQDNRRCSNPEHAKIWGVGFCFDCDMPMRSSH
jgi:hypothetical protein